MRELAEIVSIVELVFSGLAVFVYLIRVLMATMAVDEAEVKEDAEVSYSSTGFMIVLFLIIGIAVFLNVVLAVTLHRGVNNRDQVKVKKWVICQTVLSIICVLLQIFSSASTMIILTIPIIYRAWSLYVIRRFLKKLREEAPADLEAPTSFQPMNQE